MNVASLELSIELFKLSGWEDCYWSWTDFEADGKHDWELRPYIDQELDNYPAYDLGYLLRKLQAIDDGFRYAIITQDDFEPVWHANRTSANTVELQCEADTPEDAVCKLAIELLKQGVLKK